MSAAMPRLTVLFGIPTDVSEFSARAAASDYLRKYVDSTVEDSGEQLRTAWEDEYRPIVTEPLQDLIRAAQRVGGSVRRGATLADVAAATEAYDIVVILSHWKGPELANDDFTAALDGRLFVDRLRLADGPVGRWLAQAFTANGISEASEPLATRAKRKWWSWLARSKPKTVRQILREVLSADLDDLPGKSDGVDEVFENAITRMTRRRAVLDDLFQALLHPGNRLELFDGLHSQEAVEEAITPHFAGTLDLTTCTSMPLADHISAARRFVPRVVYFDEPQQPEWAAGCLKLTMDLVGDGWDYLKARAEAVEIMRAAVRELARSRR